MSGFSTKIYLYCGNHGVVHAVVLRAPVVPCGWYISCALCHSSYVSAINHISCVSLLPSDGNKWYILIFLNNDVRPTFHASYAYSCASE